MWSLQNSPIISIYKQYSWHISIILTMARLCIVLGCFVARLKELHGENDYIKEFEMLSEKLVIVNFHVIWVHTLD